MMLPPVGSSHAKTAPTSEPRLSNDRSVRPARSEQATTLPRERASRASARPSRLRFKTLVPAFLLLALASGPLTSAAVPPVVGHQGRVTVLGLPFEGTGHFKFALVDAAGTRTFWSHDGTSVAGSAPTSAISLPVSQGLFSLALGDPALAGMAPLAASDFLPADLRLRVWFDDGVLGFQQLAPDQTFTATPYAFQAAQLSAAPSVPVVAWGLDSGGTATVPGFPLPVRQIAAGAGHGLALLSDATVVAWGRNSEGQATVPGGVAPATFVAAGTNHSLAVTATGAVVAWGRNEAAQAAVPAGLSGVTRVAAGELHSLALRADGTVVAWGDNSFGQSAVPAGLSGVVAISAGHHHSVALKADGTVVAWGRSDVGQTDVPAGLPAVTAVAAGAQHTLALLADRTVVAWGLDSGGQAAVPAGLVNVTAIAAGDLHSAAVTSGGTVVAWGDSSAGQLSVPATLSDVVALASGGKQTLALRAAQIAVPVARKDEDNTFQGRVGVFRAPAVNALEVAGNASKSAAGGWLANSDRRVKEDIAPVADALATLERIRPVTFRYTPDYLARHPELPDVRYYNVVAQEFAQVFPEAVTESGERHADGSPVLQVDTYPALITALAAVRELHAESTTLRAELAALRARIQKLEAAAPAPDAAR